MTINTDQTRIIANRTLLADHDSLPLMVCGVAGVSGYNAFQQLRQKYGDTVFGQRPTKNWPLVGDGIIGADLELSLIHI